MNIWDIVILAIVAAALIGAVRRIVKGQVKCGGDCAGCTQPCDRRKDEG